MRTILVPLDGSALAERALPYAMTLAKAAQGRLILLHGVDALKMTQPPAAEALAALDAAVEKVKAEGVEAEPCLYHLYYDQMGAVICSVAEERKAELIVMSTHGRGGIGRWIYGSVADRVLREAKAPVLLIPAVCDRSWPTDRKPRLLVTIDFSDLASAALGPATELADLLDAELHLAHVAPLPTYAYGEGYAFSAIDPEAERAEAQAELQKIAGTLRSPTRSVQAHTRSGFPSSMVESLARELEIDVIVMATHGRGGLARLVLGSVATSTLQRAGVPVLLVRPAAIREAAAPDATSSSEALAETAVIEGLSDMINITLTGRELDIVERGLGELMYNPDRDLQLAEDVRELLRRCRQADPELAEVVENTQRR